MKENFWLFFVVFVCSLFYLSSISFLSYIYDFPFHHDFSDFVFSVWKTIQNPDSDDMKRWESNNFHCSSSEHNNEINEMKLKFGKRVLSAFPGLHRPSEFLCEKSSTRRQRNTKKEWENFPIDFSNMKLMWNCEIVKAAVATKRHENNNKKLSVWGRWKLSIIFSINSTCLSHTNWKIKNQKSELKKRAKEAAETEWKFIV